jgi:hypothetical protein
MPATHRPKPFDPLAFGATRPVTKTPAVIARMLRLDSVGDLSLDLGTVKHVETNQTRCACPRSWDRHHQPEYSPNAGREFAAVRSTHRRARRRARPTDFAAVNRTALAILQSLLERWLPNGRAVGDEYVALNPRRSDQHLGSFRVNLRTGRWADFAITGVRGGDPVSLAAYLAGIGQL